MSSFECSAQRCVELGYFAVGQSSSRMRPQTEKLDDIIFSASVLLPVRIFLLS